MRSQFATSLRFCKPSFAKGTLSFFLAPFIVLHRSLFEDFIFAPFNLFAPFMFLPFTFFFAPFISFLHFCFCTVQLLAAFIFFDHFVLEPLKLAETQRGCKLHSSLVHPRVLLEHFSFQKSALTRSFPGLTSVRSPVAALKCVWRNLCKERGRALQQWWLFVGAKALRCKTRKQEDDEVHVGPGGRKKTLAESCKASAMRVAMHRKKHEKRL